MKKNMIHTIKRKIKKTAKDEDDEDKEKRKEKKKMILKAK